MRYGSPGPSGAAEARTERDDERPASRRWQRRCRGEDPDRPAITHTSGDEAAPLRFSRDRARGGRGRSRVSGWPCRRVAFITWPTRKPNTLVCPALRYCATASGLRGQHLLDDGSDGAFVAHLRQPVRIDDGRRRRPVAHIFSNTSFAVGALMVPRSTSPISSASDGGLTGARSTSTPRLVEPSASPRPSASWPRPWAVARRGRRRFEVVGQSRALASARPASYSGRPYCDDEPRAARRGQLGQRGAHAVEPRGRHDPPAAGRARGSTGSRAPPPCCACETVRRRPGSQSRVSCTTAAAILEHARSAARSRARAPVCT